MKNITSTGPNDTREVVAIFSVLVTVPIDEEKANRKLSKVSDSVSNAISAEVVNLESVEPTRAASYVWLDDPNANLFYCEDCGRLFSAQNIPNLVHGLPEGTKDGATCHCLECLSWRKAKSREFPNSSL